jgi:hypothetical protein
VGPQRELGLPLLTERLELPAFWALIERESGDLIDDAGLGLIEGIGPEFELGYGAEHLMYAAHVAT